MDEGVLENRVRAEAGPEGEGVELRAFAEGLEAGAGGEGEGEGEVVWWGGGSLEHFVEQVEGELGGLGATKGSDHVVP